MSEIVNSKDAWNKFKIFAKQVAGANNISDADIQKLIKDADINDDGLISQGEFSDTLLTYEDYIKVEDSYLDAFNAIAKEDGDVDSISDKDISSILDGLEETESSESASGGAAGGGGGSGASGGSKKQT